MSGGNLYKDHGTLIDDAVSPHQVLGLSPGADAEEARRAYLRLVKIYHPDHNPSDPLAESRFKKISYAYKTIKSGAYWVPYVIPNDDQAALQRKARRSVFFVIGLIVLLPASFLVWRGTSTPPPPDKEVAVAANPGQDAASLPQMAASSRDDDAMEETNALNRQTAKVKPAAGEPIQQQEAVRQEKSWPQETGWRPVLQALARVRNKAPLPEAGTPQEPVEVAALSQAEQPAEVALKLVPPLQVASEEGIIIIEPSGPEQLGKDEPASQGQAVQIAALDKAPSSDPAFPVKDATAVNGGGTEAPRVDDAKMAPHNREDTSGDETPPPIIAGKEPPAVDNNKTVPSIRIIIAARQFQQKAAQVYLPPQKTSRKLAASVPPMLPVKKQAETVKVTKQVNATLPQNLPMPTNTALAQNIPLPVMAPAVKPSKTIDEILVGGP